MKKIIFILISLCLLTSCQTTSFRSGIDKGWDVSFYSNCQLPENTINTIEENGNKFLRFQLKNAQKGGCSTDRVERHSAPYWERAELRQVNFLDKNSIYEIKFKVRFAKGFTGERETFFQVHQYTSGCDAYPTLMLKFHNGYLRLDALRLTPARGHVYYTNSNIDVQSLLDKWHDFKIIYDEDRKRINVSVDKVSIFSDIPFEADGCGKPHIKFGIYRPGNTYSSNNTSIVDFDDIKLTKVTSK